MYSFVVDLFFFNSQTRLMILHLIGAAQPAITNFMKPLASKKFGLPDIDPESEVLDLPDMYPEPENHSTPRANATPDLRPKNLLLKKINIGTKVWTQGFTWSYFWLTRYRI